MGLGWNYRNAVFLHVRSSNKALLPASYMGTTCLERSTKLDFGV